MKKKILIAFGIFYIIFSVLMIAITTEENKEDKLNNKNEKQEEAPKWILAEHEYGDKYPYTEYYLNLYCYNSLVWLESMDGNIYPLNGLAKSSHLKNSPKFNNDTKPILKNGMQDLFTPSEAFGICYKLNDAEFQARLKRK